jgi:predicted kinase
VVGSGPAPGAAPGRAGSGALTVSEGAGDGTDGRPPLAVLVSGAPGSGKSTLAAALAVALDVPAVHKDELVHGIWRTRDRAFELGAAGVEPFYATMEAWLALGVSFVADQTFRRGVSEPDVARRLAPRSFLVNVHCRSTNALQRFEARMRADPLCGDARLRALLPLAASLQSDLAEPLAFGCPCILVDTDEGYDPPLKAVVDRIDASYSRPLLHDLDRHVPEEEGASEGSAATP